ncbi:two component AraC family transcriptional regulator [Paenibacillus sp. FSL R7-277]|uniref:response regulator transcription factor n=1 Tax=Paenibacillus sp. FSL R7-277 TaxID=1227352 RepID=UPI0003E222F0|nr:response regulator transcription factor [Paenibacillus sp. FSL R7-277]ETT59145.1 two component AraC family transcriptional regulator [Paenibacillus sp. FSL R7-277]
MYKVFIVDDEPFILSGLQDILDWEELGLTIAGQAENGQEALEQLREIPADILITDISMPVMTGLELIRAVREFRPDLKVVVLSGFDEFMYVKEGLALGIENYLLKPINLEEFQQTLETIVEKLNVSRLDMQWWEYTNSVLKDNVLLRWLRGQIDPQERSERLNLIGLPLTSRYVQVALLQVEPAMDTFRKRVSDLAEAEASFFMFWDSDNDLVLIHNYEEASAGAEEMAFMLEEITGLCTGGEKLRAAVGSPVYGVDAAPASYEQAKQAQEFLEIHPERSIIYYEQLRDRKEDLGAVLPEDWSDYAKLIMSKNVAGLSEQLELYFSAPAMDGLTPAMLEEISLEWMLFFRVLIKDIRSETERESIAEGLTAIRRANSLPALSAALRQTSAGIIGMLDRELKSPVVNQVLNYIAKSYSEDLSLKKLGFMFNIHPVYLGQLFHKTTGESFAEYMNRYRIDKAKEQLRTTNLKVHEIARSVGYWEMGYFYKQFKKYVGISPTEFKGLL